MVKLKAPHSTPAFFICQHGHIRAERIVALGWGRTLSAAATAKALTNETARRCRELSDVERVQIKLAEGIGALYERAHSVPGE